ncbi:MAG: glycosyltransferase [Pseudomonadota bacterium]
MKHLLVVNVFFAPRSYGGATVVAEEVTRALARSGEWRISVLSFSDYGDRDRPTLIRTRLPEGIDHYTLNLGGKRSADLSFENPAMNTEIATLIGTLRPDVAHLHCVQDLGIGVLEALHSADIPMILSTHDFWWLCEQSFMITGDGSACKQEVIDQTICAPCVQNAATLGRRWSRAMQMLRLPARITYPSQDARNQYERNGAPSDCGIVLPNGVRQPGPDYPAKRAARPSRRLRFGYIGGPGPMKGWAMIERAFRTLSPDDAELVLVDAATHVGSSWWGQYRFGPLTPHVTVVPGYRMDTADDFYAGIDVLLFLSAWKETFGLTSREAALRGVHVLATECGAPIEPLIDGDTATLLSGYGSVRAVRSALQKLVSDGVPEPTAAGHARIAAQIRSYDAHAAEIDALLSAVIAQK